MADEVGRVEATLAWLQETYPDAAVSAIGGDGQPAPVPAALGFPPAPAPEDPDAPTGLDTLHPDDRLGVLRAWERSRSQQVAYATARPVDGGDRFALYFIDMRDDHGIFLVVAVPDDGTAPTEIPRDAESLPPRVCWSRRDKQGHILELDSAAVEMFGWTDAEAVGRLSLPWIHPDDHDRAIGNWVEVLLAPGESRRYRVRHLRRDGSYVWLDVTNHNRLDDPEHADVYSEMVDISDEMAAHDAVREREQLLRELTDALPVGVVQFDAHRRVLHENEQLQVIVGAAGLDGLLGAVEPCDRGSLDAAFDAVLAGEVPEPVEVRLAGDRTCCVTFRPLSGSGGLACVDDVTEAARLRRELEVRATFDTLTACYTRSAILGALEHVATQPPGIGVVFVDLDRFKPVNDEFGHAAGDELLAIVGDRLRAGVRDVDLVGRLGGDEFLIVCPGVAGADDVEAIARRVCERLAEPMSLATDHLVRPRASIGVAWSPAGTDPRALVARADAAMYESKRHSRSTTTAGIKLTVSPG